MTRPFSIILAAAMLFGGSGLAEAEMLTLKVDDLSTGGPADFTIVDNDPLMDWDSRVGAISHNASTGIFDVIMTAGLSKPILGGPPLTAQMNLINITITSGAAGSLLLSLSDVDFVLDDPTPSSIRLSSAIVGSTTTGGVTISSNNYIDLDNNLFGTTGSSVTLGPIVGDSFSGFAMFDEVALPFAGEKFSLTQEVLLTFTGAGQVVSFDTSSSSTIPNPEPSSIVLFASGIACLVLLRRRPRRRKTAA